MKWWQKQLLKYGIYYYSLIKFRWPPKVGRIKLFTRGLGLISILLYYTMNDKIFFKIIIFNETNLKPFTEMAPNFLTYIKTKKIFFRDK